MNAIAVIVAVIALAALVAGAVFIVRRRALREREDIAEIAACTVADEQFEKIRKSLADDDVGDPLPEADPKESGIWWSYYHAARAGIFVYLRIAR